MTRRKNFPKQRINRRAVESTTYEPLRLKLDTYNLDLSTDLSSDQINFLKTVILPKTEEYMLKLLTVKRETDPIVLERGVAPSCTETWSTGTATGRCKTQATKGICDLSGGDNEIIVNPDYLKVPFEVCATEDISTCEDIGGGLNDTDTIIFVMSKKVGSCSADDTTTLAYAMSCSSGVSPTLTDNRPHIGMINFCPTRVDHELTDEHEIDQYVRVASHETFHALGFSNNIFPSFNDEDGTNPTMISVTERGDTTIKKMVTKKSLEAARSHFNCSTLNGLELENVPLSGSIYSHTEMRLFYGDVMNAVSTENMVFSPISMSILEDSGWYKAQWENVERLHWMENAGCDAAMNKCLTGDQTNPDITGPNHYHFCKTDGESFCTADVKAIGQCYNTEYTQDLPTYQSYFTNSKQGGMQVMDYCPNYILRDKDALGNQNTNCIQEKNTHAAVTYYGETYGSESACFESSMYNGVPIDSFWTHQGRCMKYSCIYNEATATTNKTIKGIKIIINNQVAEDRAIECFVGQEGTNIPAGGTWWGGVICPRDFSLYCGGNLANSIVPVGPPINIETNWYDWILDYYYLIAIGFACAAVGICLLILCCASAMGVCTKRTRKSYEMRSRRRVRHSRHSRRH